MDSAITSRLRNQLPRRIKDDLPDEVDRHYLEHQHYESARQVYQTLDASGLGKYTFSLIESLCKRVNDMVRQLDRLPEEMFRELVGALGGLSEARNELRDACLLFDVEEIHPLHRLVMRNRAVLRGKDRLSKVIRAWPHR